MRKRTQSLPTKNYLKAIIKEYKEYKDIYICKYRQRLD